MGPLKYVPHEPAGGVGRAEEGRGDEQQEEPIYRLFAETENYSSTALTTKRC